MPDEPKESVPARILICEDDDMLARGMARSLTRLGYEIVGRFTSGEDAVRAAQETKPDLILMDITLGGEIDGIEAAEQIRSCMDVPVVYVTAYSGQHLLDRAKKTEPYGYLEKPVSVSELKSTVETVLYKYEADKRVRVSEERLRSTLNSLHDFVFVINKEGVFTDCHYAPNLLSQLYLPPDEFIGRHFQDVLPQDVVRLFKEVIRSVEQNGLVAHLEYSMLIADEQRWFNAKVSPLITISGILDGFTIISRDITDRKQAEDALRISEEKYRTLVENLHVGVFVTTMEGKFLHANPAIVKMAGYESVEELMAVPAHQLYADASDRERFIRELMEYGHVKAFETRGRRKDGTGVWFSANSVVKKYDSGRPVSILTVAEDITERKNSEMLLQASLDLSKYANTHTLDELLQKTIDTAESLTDSNIGFFHFLEPDQKNLSLQMWSTNTKESMCNALGKGSHYSVEEAGVWVDCVRLGKPIIHNDYESLPHRCGLPPGHAHVVRELVVPVFQGDNITAVLGVGNRKTDYGASHVEAVSSLAHLAWEVVMRSRAEEALRQSQEQLKAILDASPAAIFLVDPEGRISFANPRMADLFSKRIEDLPGTPYVDFVHPESRSVGLTKMKALMAGEIDQVRLDRRYVAADGREFLGHLLGRRLLRSADGLAGLLGIIEDITERRRLETDIRQKTEEFSAVLNAIPAFVWIGLDPACRVITGNRYVNALFGATTGSNLSQTEAEAGRAQVIKHLKTDGTEYRAEELPMQQCIKLAQEVRDQEFSYLLPDGRRVFAIGNAAPLFDENGQVRGSVGAFLDITERKKSEEIVRQADRLQAVADLSAGVAHNFNNLLQIIMGNAEIGVMNLESENLNHLKENLDEIIENTRFGAETVKRLKRYSQWTEHGGTREIEVFDLSELVRQAVEMTKPLWENKPKKDGTNSSLHNRLQSCCKIRGNKTDMFEVLLNLIKNAVDASPSGGDIEIETAVKDAKVHLCIRDTGIGISKENLNRLFTPFFTTSVEAGRGLGLATSKRIVDAHLGSIHVESVKGKGAVFTITLPFVWEEPAPEEVTYSKIPERALTILAVDDVEATVTLLESALGTFGHTVLTALSGEEGIRIFRENQVDLVICDLGMPGINGWKVGSTIQSICREREIAKPPFIILTAWDGQEKEKEKLVESGVDAVIQKPVEMTTLLQIVQEVVQRQ